MGCDAHIYIEYRRKGLEYHRWESLGKEIMPDRNYFIFGVMARGVRCKTEFSFPLKGLPENLGFNSAGSKDEEDWHSHSWLNTSEFQRVLDYVSSEGEYIDPGYEAILAGMKRFEELGWDARIVFWFDN